MEYLLYSLAAYLLGSIPSGLIVGKVGYGTDIREHGSGNLGGTNTFRVLGVKAGLIVTTADILKGTTAAALPFFLGAEVIPLIIGIFAVIGHMYPVFAGFKGGKAVATSGGVILGVNPLVFLVLILSFFILLYISKYVSLSSMVCGLVGIGASILLEEYGLTIVISIFTIFVIYRHRSNIKRIINKTEPKITWM
ncbi:glycerol-3-phosphate 1-O-acyltransferase PlsY [Halobacillus litoralis]|uniref:Glycerol-3-phosphate acyltransferase n=1 Tax=Halobacillus litoralis TaxID=45668 RepID=A0A845DSG6_9BACI|nr:MULTISPECIES: glycerol-3-phosphate 1-O-acyltransferase PlsY [Halobacillus]MCA1023174.1 glycerol-3-phosphate 1-O-acyltransferase PlsY [Halobacillus litoralis]MYL19302.1 glycerol-3-phosphate 1-O-acyltransferase PlsY [Halobacillus litoralis]MYL28446.1 glycerol-3-phosphate 1-O-acyltransferase PlsY [Halobacillus halophilus]MYL38122.1 glycerol-3-phosphate 1-O-acyltransferase PlsY [Halobacillus litoralis]